MKKTYVEPEVEVICFEVEDVLTASSQYDEDELPPIIVAG